MKSTRERSSGDLEVVVAERVVLRRVQHLEQRGRRIALDRRRRSCRSRRASTPDSMTPAVFSACTMRPGIEPMYVRRCPRISASSRTPPSEIRTNFRFIASRDRLPERGLADARAGRRSRGSALSSRWSLRSRQCLALAAVAVAAAPPDAAVRVTGSPTDSSVRRCRSFCTARYSTMRSLTLSRS